MLIENYITKIDVYEPSVLARESVTYRIAVRYGLVKPQPHNVISYFERMN